MGKAREQQNPNLGPYRIELRDNKGRFTRLYSKARFFRAYFQNKAISKLLRFPDGWLVKQKRASVELTTSRHTKRYFKKEKEAKDRRKGRKAGRKPAVRKPSVEEEARETVAELPRERPENVIQTEDDDFFWSRVEALRDRLEDIERIPGQASKLIFPMEASSRGVAAHPMKRLDKKTNKWVVDRGNVFKRLLSGGAKKRNLIWWAAKTFLQKLGTKYFETVARRTSKRTLSFRVFLTTNLPKHEEVLMAPAGVHSIIYDRAVTNKKLMLERMTSQLVAGIMRSLYKGEAYPELSLTSSGAFFQVIPESAKSIGKSSTKTQNFKLAFTIFLEEEFSR